MLAGAVFDPVAARAIGSEGLVAEPGSQTCEAMSERGPVLGQRRPSSPMTSSMVKPGRRLLGRSPVLMTSA